MFVNKSGCVRRTPNWVRMDSIIGVWGMGGWLGPFPGLLLHSRFESSPNWSGWHLPEPCQRGEGHLNTRRGSRPWEERERRALWAWRGCRVVLPSSRQAGEGGRSTPPLPFSRRSEVHLAEQKSTILPQGPREDTQPVCLVRGQNQPCGLARATSHFWPLIFPLAQEAG